MKRRLPSGRIGVVFALASGIVLAASAFAYFTAEGVGTAAASVTKLTAPTLSATPATGGTVSLSWSTVAAPGAGTVTYYVTRNGESAGGGCPTSSSPTAVTSCTDSGLSPGTYQYTVTAIYHTWTATSAIASAEVTVGPVAKFSIQGSTATPTAGEGVNLTITAQDSAGGTVTTFSGSHSLVFAGASESAAGNKPAVVNSAGAPVNFGTGTALTFTGGVAAAASSKNGFLKVYRAGEASITATEGSLTTPTPLTLSVTAAAATEFALAVASNTPAAGASDSLTITALDPYGNTATSFSGTKSVVFSGAESSGTGAAPTVTNVAGTATAFGSATTIEFVAGVAGTSGGTDGVMRLYKSGSASIKATEGAITNTGVAVTVSPLAAASLALAAASTTPAPGASDNLTITAKDTYGNTATSYAGSKNLTFSGAESSPGGTAPSVTPESSTTGVNFGTITPISFTAGVSTVNSNKNGQMRLYRSGTSNVTATDGTIAAAPVAFTVSPAATSKFALAVASTTPSAGAADNLTITAQDSYGNTTPSYAGTKSLVFSGAESSPSGAAPTVTNAAGTATNFGTATTIEFIAGVADTSSGTDCAMRIYKSGAASIKATEGTITNTALAVTVSPLAASSLTLAAASTTLVAGAADNLTITAKDTYGNTATSYLGSKSLTFSGSESSPGGTAPNVTPESSTTGVNFGTATPISFTAGVSTVSSNKNGQMKLFKAGTSSVTATDGTFTTAPVAFTVSQATTSKFALAVASSTPSAGAADNLTITAQDSYGNTTPSYAGTKSVVFSGAESSPSGTAPTVTNAAGTATAFGTPTTIEFTAGVADTASGSDGVMTLYKSGAASIKATEGSITNTAVAVTVSPLAAVSLALTAATYTPIAAATDNLTLTAKDTYGNAATSYFGTKSITFAGAESSPSGSAPTVSAYSTGTATNFGTATQINFVGGVSTVSGATNGQMKLNKAGSSSVTATDGTFTTPAVAFTVAVGTAAKVALTSVTVSAGSIAAGCYFACTVTTLGNSGTLKANLAITDSVGNVVSNLGSTKTGTITLSGSPAGTISGSPVSIPATGAAISSTQFTYTSPASGAYTNMLAAASTGYATATATVSK